MRENEEEASRRGVLVDCEGERETGSLSRKLYSAMQSEDGLTRP